MSEKRYRELKVGDVIQDGDEWRYLEHPDFLQWTKCCNAGATILHDWVSEYRRPIAEPTVHIELKEQTAVQKFFAEPTENGGEVGTSRVDAMHRFYSAYSADGDQQQGEFVQIKDARQLERELDHATNARTWNKRQALLWREKAVSAEKERDEWRALTIRLAKKQCHWPDCICAKCEDWRKALAAYELKAKEGV